ncbi:hypothetical protein G195_011580 [Phytophthora kernoviae 00238/432]|uniref:Uncharacterized protein n=1 Tax=Phytophthora kernoviae 00238/432 TaxID=1284355 RepID=A0A8J4VZD2_9STRA|nr:hypothetical protein G195_011580 [Phytophthora kernoviae 00238/432]
MHDNYEEEAKTEAGETPPVTDDKEMKQDENTDGSDGPSTFDDNVAETLNYMEMYNYLHAEVKDLNIKTAKTVESALEYIQRMFAQVFATHPDEPLDEGKRHYPQMTDKETEALLRLARLIGMITMGLEHGRHDKTKVIALLTEAKQVYYDRNMHAVHTVFWTRELAAKWTQDIHSLSFRNRTFPLSNEHPEDVEGSTDGPGEKKRIWAHQIGADRKKNEKPREHNHVRLMDVSRCLDEAAIDAFIQKKSR